ncbi:hypothetical protein OAU13_00590 [bacterium]|nr:hypothetical protein [bacterium]
MKIFWGLLLIIILSTNSNAGEFRHWTDWSNEEKLEYAAFTLINYTDFAQTSLCVKQKVWTGCHEENPVFGQYPSDAKLAIGFTASQILYYYLMGKSDNPSYEKFRMVFLGTKIAVVWANDYNGIRVNKVW